MGNIEFRRTSKKTRSKRIIPQTLNPFSYVAGNPITFVDPSGEVTCTYSITGQVLTCTTRNNTTITCSGASGNNNPDNQNLRNVGPIPTGGWFIGSPNSRNWASLTPQAGTNTYGRSGFIFMDGELHTDVSLFT